ncbi:CRISPR-associated protein Cas2 [Enterococcus faecium]|uniref:CRISPR-associated protein Cas2 n=1 Tax=Enterococcus faecium TaxID=1352 RepID=UPI000DE92EA2|nr:CRISPR-associated protein Cas2 [Enterococcus faecium]NTL48819.1 CRISPR-associated protein Cas2 [Enterococcus faecium]RCF98396.1 CRISPR-associated protein Cas2 [Enterococcus faecium]RCN99910.1 CRISPR-associated protein Cas2 [Enterococcus faecium]
MDSFIISYDLNKSGKNYDDLIKKIKTYSKWAKINESVWFFKSNKKCPEIRDDLKSVMDKDDSLFVAKLTGAAAWHNTICSSQHLQEHL